MGYTLAHFADRVHLFMATRPARNHHGERPRANISAPVQTPLSDARPAAGVIRKAPYCGAVRV